MLGLSISAIGLRPFEECLDIYKKLTPELNLEFLELAVGSKIECSAVPKMPVVLHDRCLYNAGRRLPIDFEDRATWEIWKDFITWNGKVVAWTIHPPTIQEINMGDLLIQRARMEDYFGIPIYLELMPDDNWWTGPSCLGRMSVLTKHAFLLIDVSHMNLWHIGDQSLVRESVTKFLPLTKAIHLSHNNGLRDEHSLIPEDIWFNPLIEEWAKDYIVTYESLPEKYAEYERLDKKRNKRRSGS